MRPAEEALRDAWLSELWPVVREWREPAVDKAVHIERNALLDRVRDERGAA